MDERQMMSAGFALSTSGLCLWSANYPLSSFLSCLLLGLGDRNDQCQGYFWLSVSATQGNDKTWDVNGGLLMVGSGPSWPLLWDNSPPRLGHDLCCIRWWLLDFYLYILLFPYPKGQKQASLKGKRQVPHAFAPQWRFSLMLAVIAGIIICFNLLVRAGLLMLMLVGNGDNSWTTLSLMQLTGL